MKKKRTYLGDKIYEWRQQNEISQEDFADMVGVSRQTVLKWEAGLVMPQADKLQLISETIGIGLDEIMADATNCQSSADVVGDDATQESEVAEMSKTKKSRLSSKSKIIIVAIVLAVVLLVGISLILHDKVFTTSNFEGAMSSSKSESWNFSAENIGWGIFGVSVVVGVILGAILIGNTVKNKKKLKDENNGDKP